jgi:small subunit ribosomal protein S6
VGVYPVIDHTHKQSSNRSEVLAENVYEGMFILDTNRYGRDPDGVSKQIAAMIQEASGEILVSRFWEERRLAYPIKGHRKGSYWLTYFRLNSLRLSGIKRQCQLNEDIVRVLFLKVEPRIVDTLVAHAKAGTIASYSPPVAPEPAKADVVATIAASLDEEPTGA